MKNILLIGSSGMIGNLILRKCLERNDVQKITAIVRRMSGTEHTKLVEVVHSDFLDYSSIADYFFNQDVCFFCIGVYTGQVPRNEFHTITVDYAKAFATALKAGSPEATFCFLSGQGADQTGKSLMMFAQDKGIAENYITGLQFGATYIFRPGYIYPSAPRKEPNLTYRIMRYLYPFLNLVYHNGVITSEELASAMIDVAMYGGDKIIYENKDIRSRKLH